MKLVFLDFDGVLNSAEWIKSTGARLTTSKGVEGYIPMFDPAAVERLNTITDATGAAIVFSTSWRLILSHADLYELMKLIGARGNILGQTPINLDFCAETYGAVQERWQEIEAFVVANYAAIERFVILEDDCDMSRFGEAAIMTDHKVGLTDEDVQRAISILGAKNVK